MFPNPTLVSRARRAALLAIGSLVLGCSAAGSADPVPPGTGGTRSDGAPALTVGAGPATAPAGMSGLGGSPRLSSPGGGTPTGGDPSDDVPAVGEAVNPEAGPRRDLPLKPDGFLDLAPARGEPFDRAGGTALNPPPPPGWTWFSVPGTSCRDGSEAGLFIRFAESKRLLIYFEGGGACTTPGFCNFNPQSVNHLLSGTGETVIGSALGAVPGRQQPGVYQNNEITGIFSADRSENAFRDWNIVYIPYCTGDVHFGARRDAVVPGVSAPQQFVGFFNTEKFVGKLVSTFEAGLERVVVTGSSAGSFGAALNFSMISDAFAGVQTDAVLDSGVPFDDEFWPPCLQRSWRELFGLDYGLPPDCVDCFHEDGGGLLALSDYLIDKHPAARIAVISSLQDEVIRLFFTPGENQCATVTTADPVGLTIGQLAGSAIFSPATYQAALLAMRAQYLPTGRLASYFLTDANITLHQHTWRPRYFEAPAGKVSIAQFISEFLDGRMGQVGP